jgi:hypothetical protein
MGTSRVATCCCVSAQHRHMAAWPRSQSECFAKAKGLVVAAGLGFLGTAVCQPSITIWPHGQGHRVSVLQRLRV